MAASVCLLVAACGGADPEPVASPASLDADLRALLLASSDGRGLDWYRLPDPGELDRIPQDPRNPLTPAKIELGKLLFHEPALGTDPKLSDGRQTFSCASCHHVAAGFRAGTAQAIGEGGLGIGLRGEGRHPDPTYDPDSVDVQPVRSPSALNLAFTEVVTWSGQMGSTGPNEGTKWAWGTPLRAFNRLGFHGLESQAIGALSVHGQSDVDELIEDVPAYRELFAAAFPDVPEYQRETRRFAGLAIAAYERALLTDRAPFQRWLRGDEDALTREEKHGAILFFGEAGCAECHNGPSLAETRFEALGMKDLVQTGRAGVMTDSLMLEDTVARLGRGGFTQRAEDMYRFRVPQLYNASDSRFFGHGSSFESLEEIIRYKNRAEPENPLVPEDALSPHFRPLGLSDEEIEALATFVRSGLHDPDLERYVPDSLPSGRCFPNDDPASREELGCPMMAESGGVPGSGGS